MIFTWSGGKDSALALYKIQTSGNCQVEALLTTVTSGYDRVSMHGVRRSLLRMQAAALDIPLTEVEITQKADNTEYEVQMKEALLRYKQLGIRQVAFGDLFLEDVCRYRTENLARVDMTAFFPLWGRPTASLADQFITAGFKAIVTCVDREVLDKSFVGREYDESFLNDLPQHVDPCGETGEFHTFVYDGPNFSRSVPVVRGEIVLRDERFWYCDLLPVERRASFVVRRKKEKRENE